MGILNRDGYERITRKRDRG